MNDSAGVRRLERIGELDTDIQKLHDVERSAADALGKCLPFQQLHGDEMLAIVLIDCVHGTDAGMVQR